MLEASKLQAVKGQVIVEEEEITEINGIVLPVAKKPETGTVVSVGEGNKFVKVGDRVVYKKWEGSKLKINGRVYLFLEEADILAKYDK